MKKGLKSQFSASVPRYLELFIDVIIRVPLPTALVKFTDSNDNVTVKFFDETIFRGNYVQSVTCQPVII